MTTTGSPNPSPRLPPPAYSAGSEPSCDAAQPPYSLVWPEGADPLKEYPLCPDCGHNFGSQHGGADPNAWCSGCERDGTSCAVNHGAVFDAMDAARVTGGQADG